MKQWVRFALVAVALAGCAGPAAYVRVVPLKAQGYEQFTRERDDCDRQAREQPKDTREAAYVACMVARGYRGTLLVTGGGFASRDTPLEVDIAQAREVAQDTVLSDLLACQSPARDVARATRAGRSAAYALFGWWGGVVVEGVVYRPKVFAAYSNCLTPRGYTVTLSEAPAPK